MARFLPVSVVALLAAAAVAFPAGASDPWQALYRPLDLPIVAPGASCPASEPARLNFARYGVGRGIGPGPVYPIGFAQPGSTLSFVPFEGSDWGGHKVLWFVAPTYRGRVLIRGARLDAPGIVRFDRGIVPPNELRIRIGEQGGYPRGYKLIGQRYRPSVTRLNDVGCYAYQIDGATFSRMVVFTAARSS